VGSAFSVALATLDNLHYPADVFPTDRHYAEDLSAPEVEFRTDPAGGRFALVSPAPGIAPAPDPERLRAATLQHAVLTPP
jgi:hypothetical protein